MTNEPPRTEPSPEAIARATRTICRSLEAEHPGTHWVPCAPDDPDGWDPITGRWNCDVQADGSERPRS